MSAITQTALQRMNGMRSRRQEDSRLAARTAPASMRPSRFIASYVRRHPLSHAMVFLSVVAAVAFATPLSQYAVKNLVDMLAAHDIAHVWEAFAILAAIVAADNMTWRVGGWVASHTFVAVTGDIRRDLFEHLTGHAPAYFADRLPGTLAARITGTANAAFQAESAFAWNVLPPCLAIIFSICLLAMVDPVMAGFLALTSGGLAWILLRWAARGGSLHQEYASSAAAVDGELVDVINNISVVRAFSALMRERERFAECVKREMHSRGRSLRFLEKLRLFHAAATAVLTTMMLGWALLLWKAGNATTGDVVLVSTLAFSILHGTRDLAVSLVNMTQDLARLSEALATLLLPHEMTDAEDARPLPARRGEVTFEQVSFAYPGSSPVLHKFCLKVEAGQRVGLVGRSGAGKSTVLALLQRFRLASSGRIQIDGHDITEMTEESLRNSISVVPQDVMLFHRLVLENIRYGRPDASIEEVYAAAKAAGCGEFVAEMPQGYETLVGERGVKLSGGQRQRLAIARALLRNAPVLLLDEATSALDGESEGAVHRALDRLKRDRTVIAVAHRLSTLQDFDRIVVMQDGCILQDGSPTELEATDGPYRDLLKHQRANAPGGGVGVQNCLKS